MTIRMMSLGEHEDRQRKIDDLDFWKYAYCVALSGMCTGPDIVDPIVVSQVIARLADLLWKNTAPSVRRWGDDA